MTDHAFAALADRPRYVRDGAERLQAHLRQFPQFADAIVTSLDVSAAGRRAVSATRDQWTMLQEIQAAVPAATVALHVRELSWKRDPKAPRLTQFTFLVTQRVGPVLLRREFVAPST